LRRARGKAVTSGRPWYLCPECDQVIRVNAEMHKDDGHKYYFKHDANGPDCLLKDKEKRLTEEQINAARYNGQLEGGRHLRLKRLIFASVLADTSLADPILERRLYDPDDQRAHRTPDVRFTHDNTIVAVEAQVSNTSLQVMQDRQEFYADQRGLLLWIVDVTPVGDLRIYLKDVRQVHNGNLFVVNEESRDESLARREFMLWCYFDRPHATKAGLIEELPERQLVRFADLSSNPAQAELWLFDRKTELAKAEAGVAAWRAQREAEREQEEKKRIAAQVAQLSAPGKQIPAPAGDSYADERDEYFEGRSQQQLQPRHLLVGFMLDRWATEQDYYIRRERALYIASRMKSAGVVVPAYGSNEFGEFSYVMAVMLSARFRRPVYFRFSTLVELAHHVVTKYPGLFWYFRHICRQYGGDAVIGWEDTTGNWGRKEKAIEREVEAARQRHEFTSFTPEREWAPLAQALFPEVTLFQRFNKPTQ